jgi:TPR repeat protein
MMASTPPSATTPSCGEPKSDDCIKEAIDLMYGRGVVKDEAKAAKMYIAACDAKSSTGCTFMGHAYEYGKGVPKEPWRGRGIMGDTSPQIGAKSALYGSACDAGDAPSCWLLGLVNENGFGVPKDAKKGADFYARAATLEAQGCEKGSLMSCTKLGQMERDGKGGPKDAAKASANFEKACAGGDGAGCASLGYALQNGELGKPKDEKKAADYFAKGCEGGDDMGCENGGHMYEDGRGIKADKAAAQRLYKIACDRGDKAACGAYERVGGK